MMQGKKKAQDGQAAATQPGMDSDQKLKLMLFAVLWIVIIAAVLALLAPRGTPLQNCEGAVVAASKEQCLYKLALSSSNGSLCADLSGPDSTSCYFTLAEAQQNETLCTMILQNTSEAQCIDYVANATDHFAYCYKITGSGKDSCLQSMALKDYNASLCNKLANFTNRSVCSSSIAFGDALRLSNQSYCNSVSPSTDSVITAGVLVDSGAYNYSKVADNLSGYSTLLAFESSGIAFSSRDFCYLAYAAQYSNQSACSSITNVTLETSCAVITAPKQQSNASSASAVNYTELFSQCSLESGANKTACIDIITTSEALQKKNASLCGTLELNVSYECYASMADQYMNTSFCNYIKNDSIYNACVQGTYFNATAAANGTAT
jgi:hypothetical protein